MWFKKQDEEHWQRYDALLTRVRAEMEDSLTKLRVELESKHAPLPKDYAERLVELEVKMAKLYGLLIEQNNRTKDDKLSKFGRLFGGKSKDRI